MPSLDNIDMPHRRHWSMDERDMSGFGPIDVTKLDLDSTITSDTHTPTKKKDTHGTSASVSAKEGMFMMPTVIHILWIVN